MIQTIGKDSSKAFSEEKKNTFIIGALVVVFSSGPHPSIHPKWDSFDCSKFWFMWGQSQPNSPEWSQWVPKWFQLVPEWFQEVPKWSQEVFVFYVGITKLHCSGTPPSVMVSFSLEEQIWVQYSFWGIFLLYSYKFFIFIGPRLTWGPIFGSGCHKQTNY